MRHRARCVAEFEFSGFFLSDMVFSKANRAIIVNYHVNEQLGARAIVAALDRHLRNHEIFRISR